MNRDQIITAVDTYAAKSGLKQSTICQYALGNRLVYDRLVNGGGCSISSVERLLSWLEKNPVPAREGA